MPFALIIIGLFLLISSVQDSQSDLFNLVAGEFQGANNFLYWMTAILLIGAVGYIPKLKPLATAFLALIVIVLFLTKGVAPAGVGGGFFQQFTAGLASSTAGKAAAGGATGAVVAPAISSVGGPSLSPALAGIAGAGLNATPGFNLAQLPTLSNSVQ